MSYRGFRASRPFRPLCAGSLSAMFWLWATVVSAQSAAKLPELNGLIMESTFKLAGPSRPQPGERATGSAFLMGRPVPGSKDKFFYVLITAAHVLHDIEGTVATVITRSRSETKQYRRLELNIQIRNGFRNLWTQHPSEDIAAMYLTLPANVASEPIPASLLAVEEDFAKFEFHVGDEVLTTGYPNGIETSFGFGILRSGRIASHPLTPIDTVRSFLVDFSVFGGNSGGPVFINENNRAFGGAILNITRVFKILGMVTDQITMLRTGERLAVAKVVHANFIRETIELLPPQKVQ